MATFRFFEHFYQGCLPRPPPPRPAEKQAAPPREKQALPRPAPQKLTKPAGRSGAKLTENSKIKI